MEVKSKKGATHVIHEGYRYRINRVNMSSRNWRCATESKCKGTLSTPLEGFEGSITKGQHCHPPDPAEQEVYRARGEIAEVAVERPDLAPRRVLSDVLGGLSKEAQGRMPSQQTLKRDIQRKRARGEAFPRLPENAASLVVPQ